MAGSPPPVPVRPRPRPVKVLGVLNIVFGSILLAFSWLMIGSMVFNATSTGPTRALEEAVLEHARAEHQETLRRLESLERRAEHDSAREIYRSERIRLEDQGPQIPFSAQMLLMGGRMRGMTLWTAIGSALGLALNLLLIASGVGLVQRVEWGRRLGLRAASLKLPVVVVMQLIWLVWIAPSLSRAVGDPVQGMMAAQGGGLPSGAPNMTQLYAVIYSAWGAFVLIFGSIYPIILLVMLRRPGVRAACVPAERRGREMLMEAARS